MTNGDYIRSLPDEEMGYFIHCTLLMDCDHMDEIEETETPAEADVICRRCMTEWLGQEREEP